MENGISVDWIYRLVLLLLHALQISSFINVCVFICIC